MKPRSFVPLRSTALVSIVSLVLNSSGCTYTRWRAQPITELSLQKEKIDSKKVKLTTSDGFVQIDVQRLEFPYVFGKVAESGMAQVGIDLRNVRHSYEVFLDPATRSITRRALQTDPDAIKARIPGSVVFETAKEKEQLAVRRVDPPWVYGVPEEGSAEVRVDLRDVKELEVYHHGLTGGGKASVVLGVVLLAAIIIGAASSSSSSSSTTQGSCPLVYVDRGAGPELVGEAYVGAAFRSLQREDLLPLPAPPAGDVRVSLKNEAAETEYTDRAELVLVDSPPHLRPLSTSDGRLVLVGEESRPLEAHDQGRRSLTKIVADADGEVWETDVARVAEARPPLAEQLTATFPVPSGGSGSLVFEMVAGNTLWMDIVFDRFFAAMGGRLDRYLAAGNEPARGPRLRGWREREGVDLTVEVQDREGWRRVATVPTVGAAALRRVAVALPPDVPGREAEVTVRLRGGLGFWRVDALALSRRVDAPPPTTRLAPASATGAGGRDERDVLAAADGRYDVLRPGDRLELSFTLPPPVEGRSRSGFLLTSGYYNVLPPLQGKWSPATLLAIRNEPGALSRFSRDLARGYVRLLERDRMPVVASLSEAR